MDEIMDFVNNVAVNGGNPSDVNDIAQIILRDEQNLKCDE